MTAPRNPDWLIRSFLEEGQTDLPDPVYDQVRSEIEHTRQRVVIGTWTAPDLHLFGQLAMAAAAVVVVAAVAVAGINLLPSSGVGAGPSASAPASPSVAPPASPSPTPEVDPYSADYNFGRHSRTVDGVSLSFAIEDRGWEPFGNISINKSFVLSQGAEAIIYWTAFPDGASADPCAPLLSQPVGASAAELAAAVAAAPGTDLLTGPTEVTVGGHQATHVVLSVREDLGCKPGFFFTWLEPDVGAMWNWPETEVGNTIWVWIVDADGARFFIVGETHTNVGPAAGQQIEKIVDSIQFE